MTRHTADPVEITETAPIKARIAWWMENTITRAAKRVFNAIKDPVQDLVSYALREWLEDIEIGLKQAAEPLLNEMASYDNLPSWVKQTISNARAGKSQGELVLLGAIVVALGQVLARGVSDALSPMVTHRINALLRPQLADAFTAIELFRRKIIDQDDLLKFTRANGWPDWQTEQIKKLTEVLYDPGELQQGYWRGLVNDGTVADQLSKRGYSTEHIALWKELSERIPSPGDLVAIAVREGFDDSVARQFGYDEAFPGDAADAAEKGGMQKKWFSRLWRAHWRLPSVTQGFDMFHRQIITRPQLELLLRASDIPSFWRTRLIQLSFNVVTRVDVRRMYALGVLTEQQVYQRYSDGGYSPDDARDLTEWTIKEYAETERVLTRTDILSMYRESILNLDEVTAYMEALGYGGPEIGLLIAREDLAKEAAYEKEIIKNVKAGYMSGVFDENDVRAEIGKLDPPASYVDDTLQLWRLEKARRVIRPTVTQLRDMWLGEVINDAQLKIELQGRGYSEQYIEWYRSLWAEE